MSDLRRKTIGALIEKIIPPKIEKLAFYPLMRGAMAYPWERGADAMGMGGYYDDMQAHREAALRQALDAEMYRRLLRRAVPAQQADPVRVHKEQSVEDPVKVQRKTQPEDPVKVQRKTQPKDPIKAYKDGE